MNAQYTKQIMTFINTLSCGSQHQEPLGHLTVKSLVVYVINCLLSFSYILALLLGEVRQAIWKKTPVPVGLVFVIEIKLAALMRVTGTLVIFHLGQPIITQKW